MRKFKVLVSLFLDLSHVPPTQPSQMDSQLAAFEKFRASGGGSGGREHRHGHGNSRESRGHGARDDHSGPVPDLYSIHRGKVVRVEGITKDPTV